MKIVMLFILIISPLAWAGYSNTGEVRDVYDAARSCDFDKAIKLTEAITDSKLDYELTPGGARVQYDAFPKVKILGYIKFLKNTIDSCDKLPEIATKDLETKNACFKAVPTKPDNPELLVTKYDDKDFGMYPLGTQTHYFLEDCSKEKQKIVSNKLISAQDKEDDARRAKQIAAAKAKYDAELNYPDGVAIQLCNTNRSLTQLNKLLDKQKAAAEISGVADKKEMNKLGLAIVNHRESMDAGKAKYLKLSGQAWTSKLCK